MINTTPWNRLRYTLWSPGYDLVVRRIGAGRRRAIELLDVLPGERVLIDGAGTGLDLEMLPHHASVSAIDVTPAMLAKAVDRAKGLGIELDARVMDAHELDYPDASFDAVILHLMLAVVPEPGRCIREAARVLRPGGRVSIFDKFLPDGARPSLVRRLLNIVTSTLATDINRQLGPLLAEAGLVLEREEPSVFGGVFRVVIARKAG